MAIFSANADLLNDPSNYPALIRMYKDSQQVIETDEMRRAGFAMEEGIWMKAARRRSLTVI